MPQYIQSAGRYGRVHTSTTDNSVAWSIAWSHDGRLSNDVCAFCWLRLLACLLVGQYQYPMSRVEVKSSDSLAGAGWLAGWLVDWLMVSPFFAQRPLGNGTNRRRAYYDRRDPS